MPKMNRIPKSFRLKPATVNKLKWILENTDYFTSETDIVETSIDKLYESIKKEESSKSS